jgi:hypothetical protein
MDTLSKELEEDDVSVRECREQDWQCARSSEKLQIFKSL